MALTTLAKVQSEIKGTEAAKATGTDQLLMQYIRTVSGRIATFKFDFEPLYATRRYTPTALNTNSYQKLLTLGDYLLEPKTITVNGVAGAWGTDILAYSNDGQSPTKTLRIANPSSGPLQSWYPRTVQPDAYYECIAVTGFWGMRENYLSQGFFASGQDRARWWPDRDGSYADYVGCGGAGHLQPRTAIFARQSAASGR